MLCVVVVGVAVGRPISDYFLPLVNDSAFGPLWYMIGTLFTIFLVIGSTTFIGYKLLDRLEKSQIKKKQEKEQIRLEKKPIQEFISMRPNLTKNKTEDEIKELMEEYEELSKNMDLWDWGEDFHRRQKINKDN